MTDDELAALEEQNSTDLAAIAAAGTTHLFGLDEAKTIFILEALLTPDQHRSYRESWATWLRATLDKIPAQVAQARLLAPGPTIPPGRPDNGGNRREL